MQQKLHAIGTKVIVYKKVEEEQVSGLIITGSDKGTVKHGTVIHSSDGSYQNGIWVASSIKEGDLIYYDSRIGAEFTYQDVEYVSLEESDVLGVVR